MLAGVLATSTAFGLTVTGRVFVERNGDGVARAGEPGLARVAVSDGSDVVLTGKSGEYQLETQPGRLVFVSLPKGYRAAKSFYGVAEEGKALNFALAEWPESRESAVRLVQITDVHISGEETVRTFTEDIAEINALRPRAAFVVATGDLVNVGANASEFTNYVRGISCFSMPVFNLPGNHDETIGMTNYQRYLGPAYYSFNVGDCHLVMLDCNNFDAQQRDWIRRDLAVAPKGATRIFALHFLPTPEQMTYFAGLKGAAVVSGHWHGHRVQQSLGLLDLNTPPLRFGGIDRHPRGFRIVDVKGGTVANELRLSGFKHHAVVVSPSGDCVARGARLPVIVNAYDTTRDVASVECEVLGGQVPLKRASLWSWMGELKLPRDLSGPQRLVAHVRSAEGETWEAEATFRLQEAPGSTNEVKTPLRFKWAAPTGGLIGISSPRAGDGCVAVGVDDEGDLKSCGVWAFGHDGNCLWHFRTDSGVKDSIAVADGRVYVSSVAGWLYALNERNGKLLWKADLDRERDRWEVAATIVADGIVHVGAASYIGAYDAGSGELLWRDWHVKTDFWPSGYVTPTVAQGKLIQTTLHGAYALDPSTGRWIWELNGIFYGCLATGDTVYTIRTNLLTAVGLADGKVKWTSTELVGDTASAPAIAGDRLVMGTADGRVCAFSTQDGSRLWSIQTGPSLASLEPYRRNGSDVNSSPAISGGTVYVGASDGEVYALSLATGAKLGSYRLGVPIGSSPLIEGGTLYIGAYDGNLYAFEVDR